MSEQTGNPPKATQASSGGMKGSLDWPLIRKFESLIFTSMIVAIPFFAYRVVDLTSTQLAVKQTAVDLVKDLVRAKDISKEFGLAITVSGRPGENKKPGAYLIQNGERTIEEVVLPKGVSVLGAITFDEQGVPSSRGTFTISKGWKTQHVNIGADGIASLE